MIAFPWSNKAEPARKPTLGGHVWRLIRPRLASISFFLLVAIFAGVVLYPYAVVTVPSGEVGVLWRRFGGGTELDERKLLNEGLHVIPPWDRVFNYNLRIQSKAETYKAISSDGVNLTAKVNNRFQLRRKFIPQLHQTIGPDYSSLLGPEIASRMREVISEYTAEQVYSTARQRIQEEIKDRVGARLSERFLENDGSRAYRVPITDVGTLFDTLLHEIELPTEVIAAINRKVEQYYVAQEYAYRVDRERRESERKKIEAEGVRDFQQTVSQGISESYLRWRGIEATLELAKSNNSKIVIIGGGRDGLPIILGNVDTPFASPEGVSPNAPETNSKKSNAKKKVDSNRSSESGNDTATSNADAAARSTQSGASVDDRQSPPSFGRAEIENMLSRFWRTQRSRPEASKSNAPETPTAE